jgi:lipid II:glycine glycyltransferase (peptidoglycan interpeptide bridge formation enzyme)
MKNVIDEDIVNLRSGDNLVNNKYEVRWLEILDNNFSILNNKNRTEWQKMVDSCPYGDILQYPQWGRIKQTENWESQIMGVFNGEKLVAGMLILSKKVGFGIINLGYYAYSPHSPIFDKNTDLAQVLPLMVAFLKQQASKKNWISLEIEPKMGKLIQESNQNQPHSPNLDPFINGSEKILLENGFKKTGRNMQPKYKLLYDLDKSEEELLKLCTKSTRYNIKLAKKRGVVVKEFLPDNPEIKQKLKVFYDLLLETRERAKGYPIRSLESFEKMFEVFKGTDSIALFEASFNGQVIAMNISERTGYWASSFYASSNRLYSEVKAPYLLRWTAIMKAKEMGCKIYDFWGIIPSNLSTSGQHKGYSDHKLSFGGTRIDHIGLLSLVFSPFKAKVWDFLVRTRTGFAIFIQRLKNQN